jgi:hypothetical protein
MRIQVQIEGGIAHFPGLARPRILDSATLSPQDAHELHRLVEETAHFFTQPTAPRTQPQGADCRTYTLTIEDDPRQHSIRVCDPVSDPHLQALLTFVQQHLTS